MLSVVIPVFDEEQSLGPFYKELTSFLKEKNYEIIFVDDGSTDDSLDILKKFKDQNKAIRIFSFRKNQSYSRVKAEDLLIFMEGCIGLFPFFCTSRALGLRKCRSFTIKENLENPNTDLKRYIQKCRICSPCFF